MISHKDKFIFIHVPKTGGYSICKSFNRPSMIGHKYLEDYPQEHVGDYYKFSFVRNPWDRFLSAYSYFKKGGRKLGFDEHSQEIVNRYESFKDFVLAYKDIKDEFVDPHFLPQTSWTHDEDGSQKVDFIGRYETFQEDFNEVCSRMKVKERQLPHWNNSQHKSYTEYYDEDTIEAIAKEFKRDIELLDYSFDKGNSKKNQPILSKAEDRFFNVYQKIKIKAKKIL